LEITSSESKFDAKNKYTAHTLLQNWSKFEIILTAAIYLHIFPISSPVSKFLRSRSLNYQIAFNMTTNLLNQIKEKRNNGDEIFNKLISKVQNFITKINKELELNDKDFRIKNKFSKNSVSRVPKINKMLGGLASDERPDVFTE